MIIEQDRLLSPSSTRDYPLVAARGTGCWLEDVDGNQFLDFSAGIAVCSSGHCHSRVVAAVTRQAQNLIHMSGTDFYYEPQGVLARKLQAHVPIKGPQRVFFTNSGAEAIEGAIKLARYATGRPHLIAFTGAFHGRTLGALSLTNSKLVQRQGFGPLLPEVSHLSFPGRADVPLEQPFQELADLFRRKVAPEQVAAIFVEPIQGEGGYIVPPPGFHRQLRDLCSRHGILLVMDEIQTGVGRTGKFCAIEHWNVEPDVVCLAKGIASGLPLGAIVARADLMHWPPGSHGSTFGGNPVACAAAIATLEVLEEGLLPQVAEMGGLLVRQLRELANHSPLISKPRGLGLMVAADLPDPQLRNTVLHSCFRRGLILLGAGERAIRFCPPLVVNPEEIEVAVGILRECLSEIGRQPISVAG
jgi:4-aminobutyrate aminotransferase